MNATQQDLRATRLIWLSDEHFPRLRSGGRLQWLGKHGEGINYHDPRCDYEVFVDEDTDKTFDDHDPTHFCPLLPEGVWVCSVGCQVA